MATMLKDPFLRAVERIMFERGLKRADIMKMTGIVRATIDKFFNLGSLGIDKKDQIAQALKFENHYALLNSLESQDKQESGEIERTVIERDTEIRMLREEIERLHRQIGRALGSGGTSKNNENPA
jgi:hypothetical protein